MRAICAQCKRIRDDEGNWSYKLYNEERRDTLYTHSLCPKCAKEAIAEIEKARMQRAIEKKKI